MRIFRGLLDEDLDRTPECLNSERHVDVSVEVRSLLRTGRDVQPGGAAPGVALLPETPLMKALPFQSWSPYKLEDGPWGSCWMGAIRKLPDNLVGCSIQITTRGRETWIATVVGFLERRANFILVRDSGKG